MSKDGLLFEYIYIGKNKEYLIRQRGKSLQNEKLYLIVANRRDSGTRFSIRPALSLNFVYLDTRYSFHEQNNLAHCGTYPVTSDRCTFLYCFVIVDCLQISPISKIT